MAKRAVKRRGRGEGSIFQRTDGRWSGMVTVGTNGNGKRIRKAIYGATKQAVQEKMSRLQVAKLDGNLCDPGRITMASYLDRWLEDSARPTVRQTTYRNYAGVIKKHINPTVGGVALSRLSPPLVQGLYSAMERAGKSPRLRQLTHAILHRALKQAMKWGMVPRNVCDAVDPPRVARHEVNVLTGEQVATLLAAASGARLEALFTLALTTGLRQGELFGLQWADVDLDGGTLAVRRTVQDCGKSIEVMEPKTPKSRRKVDLPGIAVDALLDHRKAMLAEGLAASPWVFCDHTGGPLRKSNFIRREFKPLLFRASFKAWRSPVSTIRFHDLRHTSATMLLGEGVHPKVVQERLGHATIGMTMDTYSHVLPTMQRDAADRMERLMRRNA